MRNIRKTLCSLIVLIGVISSISGGYPFHKSGSMGDYIVYDQSIVMMHLHPILATSSPSKVIGSIEQTPQISDSELTKLQITGYPQLLKSLSPKRNIYRNSNTRVKATQIITGTCVVTTLNDSGPNSFRQCLLDVAPGATINFNPQVFPPTEPVSITLFSPLPWIITSNLLIDASNAGVILDGRKLTNGNGLVLDNANSTVVRGMQILNFPQHGIALINGSHNCIIGGDRSLGTAPLGQGNLLSRERGAGVWFQDSGTTGNKIQGNYIGTDVTGTEALGNQGDGIDLISGVSNNIIGGDVPNTGNLISGNQGVGVWFQDSGTTGNKIQGNYIGTDVTGTRILGNQGDGIDIHSGASDNIIGGDVPNTGNLISGNQDIGVWLAGSGTTGNKIQGNYIGTDVTGNTLLGNKSPGIGIGFGASGNTIGGDTQNTRNLISGNGELGILIQNDTTIGNIVLGNFIGTNVTGLKPLANHHAGIMIALGANGNIIGGDRPGTANLISGNEFIGVLLLNPGTTGNRVLGNYIGTDMTGAKALGNGRWGVGIGLGASGNIIGGNTPNARNIISGNGESGVMLQHSNTIGNRILGNYIGVDVTGVNMLGNGANPTDEKNKAGIVVSLGTISNTIGGERAGEGNLISGNNGTGIQIKDTETKFNRISGNAIGTNFMGTEPLPNLDYGIDLLDGAISNTIGISNMIAYNALAGIAIEGEKTLHNTITRNMITLNGGREIEWKTSPINNLIIRLINYSLPSALLVGHTCGKCRVELFANAVQEPAGTIFIATIPANEQGDFSLILNPPVKFPYLSATATNEDGDTSGFSQSLKTTPTIFLPLIMH